jgi:hypothetical protein
VIKRDKQRSKEEIRKRKRKESHGKSHESIATVYKGILVRDHSEERKEKVVFRKLPDECFGNNSS